MSAEELYRRFFESAPDPEVMRILESALGRGIATLAHFYSVFSSLELSLSLPTKLDVRTAKHFAMWLEVINHGYFTPIITSPGRLRGVARLLVALPQVASAAPLNRIADVGTGHPAYTSLDLATQFANSTVYGFDLYEARYLLRREDGAFGIFDIDGSLRAIQASDLECLHKLILDWTNTRTIFSSCLEKLISVSSNEAEYGSKGWVLQSWPSQELLRAANNDRIKLYTVNAGDFRLEVLPQASLDLTWTFNCLLHYPQEFRNTALRMLAARCRDGGFIFEGYTSPSGKHAIFQLWQRQVAQLRPLVFGWTSSNLRYPLWPLHTEDPQVKILARLLRWTKMDTVVGPIIKREMDSCGVLSSETVKKLTLRFTESGLPTSHFEDTVIIHNLDTASSEWITGELAPICNL
jgi:hypothetical protein